jgi:dienelactone hydrolase
MTVTEELIYQHADTKLRGWLYRPDHIETPLPAIMIAHDWSGCNDLAKERAKIFAEQGYIGFAIDMYGDGRVGSNNEEKQALMQPLMNNRKYLVERMQIALSVLNNMPKVKQQSIAAIGFCFGGLCVLDLARSGANLKAVVSFHGFLDSPLTGDSHGINAHVLALHGYDDPMVSPKNIQDFADEMTKLKANWEIHMYGQTSHAFTNPLASEPEAGLIYQPETARKAFRAMNNFLGDLL